MAFIVTVSSKIRSNLNELAVIDTDSIVTEACSQVLDWVAISRKKVMDPKREWMLVDYEAMSCSVFNPSSAEFPRLKDLPLGCR